MEGIFLRLIASSKPPNFTIFSWKVFVSRGPCYKDIMGRFFLPPDFRQIRQTFKIFLEGVSFSGVFVTYIRWRVFFSWPAASSKLPNFTVFSCGVFRFWGAELLVYNGRFFCSRLPVKFAKLPNLFLEGWNFEGAELLIYNERTFFCSRLPIKFAKLLKIFLEGVRLRHSVLLVYNERSFSVVDYPSNSPNFWKFFGRVKFWGGLSYWYIMRGLFPSQDTAARNPAWWVHCSGKLCRQPPQGIPHKEPWNPVISETRNPA